MREHIDFERVVRLGQIRGDNGRKMSVFCKIKYEDGKLSITGVEGPTLNGNCRGGCGQISKPEIVNFAFPWNQKTMDKFFELWERWHLNDLRAGCEHQRALGWGKISLEIATYRLTSEASRSQSRIESEAIEALEAGNTVCLSAEHQETIALKWEIKRPAGDDQPETIKAHYKLESTEKKLSNWVNSSEHPDGVLCKPCPECGYKYGTAWKTEKVPYQVLRWLHDRQETDTEPAWV